MNSDFLSFQKNSYINGTDWWNQLDIESDLELFYPEIYSARTILIIGTKRGDLALKLASPKQQIIGLEFIDILSDELNRKVTKQGLRKNIQFVFANLFELPFKDHQFDLIIDNQTFQFLDNKLWPDYVYTTSNLLKKNGTLLSINSATSTTLSPRGLSIKNPKNFPSINCHNFDTNTIEKIFSPFFHTTRSRLYKYNYKDMPHPLLFTLIQKCQV